MEQLLSLRYVAVGGAIGTLVQWAALTIAEEDQAGETIFMLNVAGAALFGILLGLGAAPDRRRRVTENQMFLVGTGFCGGLTTVSTFALQAATALDDGALSRAATIAAATMVFTVVSAGLGYRIGSRL